MKLILLGIVLAGIGVDRLIKFWAQTTLAGAPGGTLALWPGVFHLTYVENRGAAFGILQNQRWVFIVLTVAVAVALLWKLFVSKRKLPAFAATSLALVLSGAVGNLIDRVHLGYVVDMFDFRLINFAVFNVADSCVVVGVILFAIWLLFLEGKRQPQQEETRKDAAEEDRVES